MTRIPALAMSGSLISNSNMHPAHRNFLRLLFIYSLSHALFVGLENGFILGTITVLVSIPKQLD
jgi:hypothetical protein